MKERPFDGIARLIATNTSRRQVLRALAGAALGGLFARGGTALAKSVTCSSFCGSVFGEDTAATTQCVQAAKNGGGLCYSPCGPKGSGGGTLCGSGATAVCCPLPGQCQVSAGCLKGQCAFANARDGTPCDDGNACTLVDTCQAGVCTGSNPVVCVASDQCHVAGTCDPTTGQCSNPTAPDGTTCDDGNACTQTDTCQAGVCTGSNPVVCAASDQCHVAGTCDPTTGGCSNPVAPDGTACQAAGGAGTCHSGVCVLSA
jgi:hypothetical protein